LVVLPSPSSHTRTHTHTHTHTVLGFEDDYRQYGCVSEILEHLQVCVCL
jgi:GTP cyclohydrolase II